MNTKTNNTITFCANEWAEYQTKLAIREGLLAAIWFVLGFATSTAAVVIWL